MTMPKTTRAGADESRSKAYFTGGAMRPNSDAPMLPDRKGGRCVQILMRPCFLTGRGAQAHAPSHHVGRERCFVRFFSRRSMPINGPSSRRIRHLSTDPGIAGSISSVTLFRASPLRYDVTSVGFIFALGHSLALRMRDLQSRHASPMMNSLLSTCDHHQYASSSTRLLSSVGRACAS